MKEETVLVPKRRFKEFQNSYTWEQRRLGDVSVVTKLAGFEFTEYVTYSDEGTIIALRGLNVKNGKIILEDVKYIDQSDFSKLNRSKLFKDDILFTYVGTVGELAIIPEDDKYYLAPNVARIRLDDEINSQFVIQMMGSKTYYNKVIFPLIATSSQPALSMENVRKFILKLPSYEEQTKIGHFFSQLDHLITLHQRKLEKTKALKAAYLSEMFPAEGEREPKRRFAGFSGTWEQRKLRDFRDENERYSFTGGPFGSDLKSSDYTEDGVRIIQLQNIGDGYFADDYKIYTSEEKAQSLSSNLIYPGEIIIAKMADPLARAAILPGSADKYLMASDGIRLKVDSTKYHSYFILTLINSETFRKRALENSTGTTRKRIGLVTLGDLMTYVPSYEEQTKIGTFFESVDNLITLHQGKLEKLQNIKKAYLNEMFV